MLLRVTQLLRVTTSSSSNSNGPRQKTRVRLVHHVACPILFPDMVHLRYNVLCFCVSCRLRCGMVKDTRHSLPPPSSQHHKALNHTIPYQTTSHRLVQIGCITSV